MTSLRFWVFLPLLLLVPTAAHAEYTRIDLTILGMDWITCAHAVRVAVQKVDGVESVEVSLRKPTVVRLRPGNRVTLDQFRQLVKHNGFELKGITVTAIARPSERSGKPALEVSGIGTVLLAARGTSDGRAYDQVIELVRSNKTATIEVTGAVEKDSTAGTETIAITGVREIRN